MDNSSYNVETEKSKQNINTNNSDIINTMLKCYELYNKMKMFSITYQSIR